MAARSSTDAVKSRPKSQRKRLDLLLVERGLAESRQRAQGLILAGQVFVNGQKQDKAGAQVAIDAGIEITGGQLRYASRGGLKLEGALEEFGISVREKICLDIGASTGGFTDCLLEHGAQRVYAVDVNVNQLAWKLQRDTRVVRLERNARELHPDDLGEPVELVAIDVSFISVTKILRAAVAAAKPGADFLILVKPQFELDRGDVGKGGIVSDPRLHERAVERVKASAAEAGLAIVGARPSRLPGAEGNQEFFLHARREAVE
ncbi:MAG TPA: TlyA family RNA methyltransferase [Candidatus Acidoferrales bacterium]|jgi:23S rRNA (cytidine1920-2'-O)/16S rRNA (cytidine1409-2'-O)-methyltransferase|nr:TlyA family RNA methyltransferase [Candidatus Acidoferrales bacterium]